MHSNSGIWCTVCTLLVESLSSALETAPQMSALETAPQMSALETAPQMSPSTNVKFALLRSDPI